MRGGEAKPFSPKEEEGRRVSNLPCRGRPLCPPIENCSASGGLLSNEEPCFSDLLIKIDNSVDYDIPRNDPSVKRISSSSTIAESLSRFVQLLKGN